ncbi:MAG: hypothetical protein TEF_18850 [Rhizobiales bacterium NRL2]|jgi:crotonobetainyl-CoA:carnitine CoA-transferase CaiB-like acyl-CoA transferase|nr:MAG: hypothetical protein TEF_18850 [Rhizobiales bacterium NRL2]
MTVTRAPGVDSLDSRPLEGLLVLDFTQFVAGPVCTRALAELGAEVIKIELAPTGDHARRLPVLRNGRSAYFIQQNLGKKSLCVDIHQQRGLDLVQRLVVKADVMVENFSPGVIGRLGLGWEVVHALNPDLILCQISAFGQEGPLANLPGFDHIGQAYSGIMSLIGDPDASPPFVGAAIGDVGAGVSALAALNAALYGRMKRGGGGERIDVSLLDFYFHGHAVALETYTASGGEIEHRRSGPDHMAIAPAGVFKAREGHVVLLPVGEDMWRRLLRAMGRPDLGEDERFHDSPSRYAYRDEIRRIIEAWFAEQPSDAAAINRLQAERVPCAPVLTVADAIRHPQLLERQTVIDIDDPALGPFKVPGSLFRLPDRGDLTSRNAPDLGEHNGEILAEHLGLSAAEIGQLEAGGVLRSAPVI